MTNSGLFLLADQCKLNKQCVYPNQDGFQPWIFALTSSLGGAASLVVRTCRTEAQGSEGFRSSKFGEIKRLDTSWEEKKTISSRISTSGPEQKDLGPRNESDTTHARTAAILHKEKTAPDLAQVLIWPS